MFVSHSNRSILIVIVLALVEFGVPTAEAQVQRREPTPNDTLRSIEVSADQKVTFRIYAPKAAEVSVSPRSVALMSSNHLGEMFGGQLGRPTGMGFGLTVEVVIDSARAGMYLSEGSYGWDGTYGTRFWVDPKDEMAVVFLIQSPAGPVVGGIHRDFETAVMQSIVE